MSTPIISVLLVRETAEFVTGGKCCQGRAIPGGDEDPSLARLRRQQEHFGALHRMIRRFYPEPTGESPDEQHDEQHGPRVELVTVDPRNQLYLLGKLWSDLWRSPPPLGEALATALEFFSPPAVIVDGRIITSGDDAPPADAVLHAIAAALERQDSPQGGTPC
jgi:hypothetical protein